MPPNDYLAVAISYLFTHRPDWAASAGVGKTIVSSDMIARVAKGLGRPLREVPVGFKWFVDGLLNRTLGFGGEESAGASFVRREGNCWTTDKDGLIMGLLAAEITAVMGKDPGELYKDLVDKYGQLWYARIDAAANAQQKDPRVGLKAGLYDAQTAQWNMRLISTTQPADSFKKSTNSDLAFNGNLSMSNVWVK